MRPPLALTLGDPSGIGPELALMAYKRYKDELPPFFCIAPLAFMRDLNKNLNFQVECIESDPERALEDFERGLPIFPLDVEILGNPGEPVLEDGYATLASLDRAIEAVRVGLARAVVTNPVTKARLYKIGFDFPGTTEYLGARSEILWGLPCFPAMLLWSKELAIVPITIHIALNQVSASLTQEKIITTARTVAQDFRSRFKIAHPRLAFCGLNPHAGENGTMGREEIDIIIPALDRLRLEGMDVLGPLPADTMFHAGARKNYDVALAMYHDQALIPIKTIAFDKGVNATLGLPFVRTSPDHGTAIDIAGKAIADPDSLVAALHLADRLA